MLCFNNVTSDGVFNGSVGKVGDEIRIRLIVILRKLFHLINRQISSTPRSGSLFQPNGNALGAKDEKKLRPVRDRLNNLYIFKMNISCLYKAKY